MFQVWFFFWSFLGKGMTFVAKYNSLLLWIVSLVSGPSLPSPDVPFQIYDVADV